VNLELNCESEKGEKISDFRFGHGELAEPFADGLLDPSASSG
jgi:hypothetical protein